MPSRDRVRKLKARALTQSERRAIDRLLFFANGYAGPDPVLLDARSAVSRLLERYRRGNTDRDEFDSEIRSLFERFDAPTPLSVIEKIARSPVAIVQHFQRLVSGELDPSTAASQQSLSSIAFLAERVASLLGDVERWRDLVTCPSCERVFFSLHDSRVYCSHTCKATALSSRRATLPQQIQ